MPDLHRRKIPCVRRRGHLSFGCHAPRRLDHDGRGSPRAYVRVPLGTVDVSSPHRRRLWGVEGTAMRIGLQIPDFTWPNGAAALGSDLAAVARTADEIGFEYLAVM